MKNAPNSKTNLDRAILRFAGDVARSNDLRSLMANLFALDVFEDVALENTRTTEKPCFGFARRKS